MGTSPTQGHSNTLSLESSTYEVSGPHGNPAAIAQMHPPNSSDPRQSPKQVHPHNKVKKGCIQRYYNKSFKHTLRHSTGGVPRLTVWLASTDFNDALMPLVMVQLKLLRNTPLLSQTGEREEPPLYSPEQKAKSALHKNKQDSSRIHIFTP